MKVNSVEVDLINLVIACMVDLRIKGIIPR